jgi:hypothetical protein
MTRTRRIRRTEKLSDRLQRDLSLYALAAGAAGVSVLALAPGAEGQIVYTPAHVQLAPGGMIPVDLNHDGVTDFTIRQFRYVSGHSYNRLEAVPSPHGGIKKGADAYLGAAMLPGADIGGSQAFVRGAAIMASTSAYSSAVFGSWLTATNCYLGIQFHIDGDTHYGWARVTVGYFGGIDHDLALLTGYAYETRANKSIIAGDTGEGGDVARGTLGALAGGSSDCPFAGNPEAKGSAGSGKR